MKISILTLFPDMFQGPFDYSIIKRAKEKGIVEIEYVDIREFGVGKHKLVDDTPYGGGVGMVMRVDVVHAAIEHAKKQFTKGWTGKKEIKRSTILMSAAGKSFSQPTAKTFAELDHLIIICGHYEGIDDRIREFIDEEVSIGDFVVTGGELPAMLIVDAVTRLIPGVITEGATDHESFSYAADEQILLEYPQYTKPPVFNGLSVPEILLSGNHGKIDAWKKTEARKKTELNRPDLLS